MSSLTKNQKRKQRLQNKKANELSDFMDDLPAVLETTETPTVDTSDAATHATETPTETPISEHKAGSTVTRAQVIEKANQMWKEVKQLSKVDAEYKAMKDTEKLEIFRARLGFGPFMDEFPIVSRYMVCYGQYSSKSLDRMLDKTERAKHPPPNEREKGYMEDQWIRRQADYVQYLWEAYQKRHIDAAERGYIWQETYKRLKGEFDDFRTMHKDIEDRVKEEKKELAAKNARELLERLSLGDHVLTADEEEYLLTSLQELANKKTFNNVLADLKKHVKLVDPKYEGQGTGPEQNQKITMIETVDVNRMNEIDDKYKPAELRGMEPVLDDVDEADDGTEEILEIKEWVDVC